MKNPCLVIIDVQEKLFPVMNDRQALLKNLIILIKGFQLFNASDNYRAGSRKARQYN